MAFVIQDDIEQYAFQHTQAEPDYLRALTQQTYQEMESPHMLTGRLEGRFLKMLVQILQPDYIFEIGTFTGYSALSMAEGMSADGKIITCEIDPKAQKIAQAAIDASPYGKNIEIRMGKALETIRNLDVELDMAFIDADKTNYINYYEAVLPRLRCGGVIVLDNMLWSGQVLDPEDEASRVLAELNQIILDDKRVENVLLTVRDGMQLVRKMG